MQLPFLKKSILVTVFSLLVFMTRAQFSSPLPETWQPGMTLTLSYGGGMRYYSCKLQISDTGSYLCVNEEGRISEYTLNLDARKLDSLLAFLHKNKFDQIKTVMSGPAHDKGTEQISLNWNGGYAGAGESYMTDIAEPDKQRYQAVYIYVQRLAEANRVKVKSGKPFKHTHQYY